jgi:hypothetical protein
MTPISIGPTPFKVDLNTKVNPAMDIAPKDYPQMAIIAEQITAVDKKTEGNDVIKTAKDPVLNQTEFIYRIMPMADALLWKDQRNRFTSMKNSDFTYTYRIYASVDGKLVQADKSREEGDLARNVNKVAKAGAEQVYKHIQES